MGLYDLMLIGVFLILVLIRVPIALCMLLSSFLYVMVSGKMPVNLISQSMVDGVYSFTTLAIPLFMATGEIMNSAGLTRRLFHFADTLVGHITGGLGHVNVLASLFFSGVSGSAAADAAGLGNIEIKAMTDQGFDADFAVGITAASSIIGPIFPPSGPMILFGTFAGISVGAMFMGGMTVGIIMTIFLMATVYIICKKKNYPVREKAGWGVRWRAFLTSFWALLLPPFLVIGLNTGLVSTTEVGALAVMYALFLGFVVYRELKFGQFREILKKIVETVGMIMLLLAGGTVFARVLGAQKVPQNLGALLMGITDNYYIVIFIILCFLLFLGTFMETTAAILICIPLLMPIVDSIGINRVQFGIVMIFALMIGLLTPPMAICLFITSKIGRISFERAFRAVRVYNITFLVILLLIAYFPQITLWLPEMVFGGAV